jgi:hypothetical protein
MITAYILVGILLAMYARFVVDSARNRQEGRAVYMGSSLKQVGPLLEQIIAKYVPDTAQVSFIEPGAGLGYIARFVARRFAWRQVVAIEITLSIYLLSRLWNAVTRARVTTVRGDVLQYMPPRGAVVYSYLTTAIISRLFREGKLKGCLFISLTFEIEGARPVEVFALQGWQKQVLVYDFR